MNWQAIGAIGEIVGAVAVVATLLYLARDIRQNSRSLAISALRDTTANWNQWGQMVATSASNTGGRPATWTAFALIPGS